MPASAPGRDHHRERYTLHNILVMPELLAGWKSNQTHAGADALRREPRWNRSEFLACNAQSRDCRTAAQCKPADVGWLQWDEPIPRQPGRERPCPVGGNRNGSGHLQCSWTTLRLK